MENKTSWIVLTAFSLAPAVIVLYIFYTKINLIQYIHCDGIGCAGLIFVFWAVFFLAGLLLGLVPSPFRHKLIAGFFSLILLFFATAVANGFLFTNLTESLSYSILPVGGGVLAGAFLLSLLNRWGWINKSSSLKTSGKYFVYVFSLIVALGAFVAIVQIVEDVSGVEARVNLCYRVQPTTECFLNVAEAYDTAYLPKLCVVGSTYRNRLCSEATKMVPARELYKEGEVKKAVELCAETKEAYRYCLRTLDTQLWKQYSKEYYNDSSIYDTPSIKVYESYDYDDATRRFLIEGVVENNLYTSYKKYLLEGVK